MIHDFETFEVIEHEFTLKKGNLDVGLLLQRNDNDVGECL
jgi:hypothetical protein